MKNNFNNMEEIEMNRALFEDTESTEELKETLLLDSDGSGFKEKSKTKIVQQEGSEEEFDDESSSNEDELELLEDSEGDQEDVEVGTKGTSDLPQKWFQDTGIEVGRQNETLDSYESFEKRNTSTDVALTKESFKKCDLDFSKFKKSKAKQVTRNGFRAGIMSIIKSKRNGKRIVISRVLYERLGCPETVQFLYGDEELLISEELDEADTSFRLKEYGAKYVIYSSSLVEEIAEELKLDFSDCVCQTLINVEYKDNDGTAIAVISK